MECHKLVASFDCFDIARSRTTASIKDPLRGYKRTFFLLLVTLVGAMTVITVLTAVSKSRSDKDPFLDPVGNPNIRVASADDRRLIH